MRFDSRYTPSRLRSGVHIRFIVLNPRYASADVIIVSIALAAFNSARFYGKCELSSSMKMMKSRNSLRALLKST